MQSRFVFPALVLIASFADAQTAVDLRVQSRDVDFSSATTTKPFKSGTALPATCGVGEMFFLTNAPAGYNVYACPAVNSWALQSGGTTLAGDVSGPANANVVTRIQGRPVSSAAPAAGQSLVWNATANSWAPQTITGGSAAGVTIAVNGNIVGTQPTLNFSAGTGTTVNCTNNPGAGRIDCGSAMNSAVALTIAMAETGLPIFCRSTNGTTAYTCSLSAARALTQYELGMILLLYVDTTCASSCNLSVDGVGITSIKKIDGSTDPGGALVANQPQLVFYNGTVFVLMK